MTWQISLRRLAPKAAKREETHADDKVKIDSKCVSEAGRQVRDSGRRWYEGANSSHSSVDAPQKESCSNKTYLWALRTSVMLNTDKHSIYSACGALHGALLTPRHPCVLHHRHKPCRLNKKLFKMCLILNCMLVNSMCPPHTHCRPMCLNLYGLCVLKMKQYPSPTCFMSFCFAKE